MVAALVTQVKQPLNLRLREALAPVAGSLANHLVQPQALLAQVVASGQ